MQASQATHRHLPVINVEQLGGPPKLPQHHATHSAQASIKATKSLDFHQADCKRKLSCSNPKAASQAAHKSTHADYDQHLTPMLAKVPQPMHKVEARAAYKALKQLSKLKSQPRRQLLPCIPGRQLPTAS